MKCPAAQTDEGENMENNSIKLQNRWGTQHLETETGTKCLKAS